MRYLVEHPLPDGITRQEIEELQKASLSDKEVHGYRSFLNLSQCRGYCVFDAPSQERLVSWLNDHNLSYDHITEIELEGERGKWVDIPAPAPASH